MQWAFRFRSQKERAVVCVGISSALPIQPRQAQLVRFIRFVSVAHIAHIIASDVVVGYRFQVVGNNTEAPSSDLRIGGISLVEVEGESPEEK
jgi:hypothetical protein